MDPYSSGEDLLVKARKPYTITKQRERWTEDEHNRFLEALKLYGRAWQRIEEHIGTKTAVQIRSHAQKFFTKLEKEALVKGVPIGQTLDIDIPPPRPKRKPSNPYPRKTSTGAPTAPTSQVGSKDGKLTTVSSLGPVKDVLDLEKEPFSEKPGGDENLGNAQENRDENNFSEVFTLCQEIPCTSLSSANKNPVPTPVAPRHSYTFREFVPILKEAVNQVQEDTNESYLSVEPKGNEKLVKLDAKQLFPENASCNTSNLGNSHPSFEKSIQIKIIDDLNQPKNFGYLSTTTSDMQATQNYPRHVPVQILDGSLGINSQRDSPSITYQESIFHQMEGVQGQPNLVFTTPAASATTENNSNASRSPINQSFPAFHPLFNPIHNNQDDYHSYLHILSTFSSLIVSALLQNPAAHAAASFAATFLPCANSQASTDSSAGSAGGFPSRQTNSAPSMAAIASATVAAATAWWAAHGLLPLCAPLHSGFACSPTSATVTQMDKSQARAATNERSEETSDPGLQGQHVDPEYAEALQEQDSASKSPTLSLSYSEENEGAKTNMGFSAADTEQAEAKADLDNSNKTKGRKQVDRSSCGSNTPSSSEVETDALEKHEKDTESKEPDVSHPVGDSSCRRGRTSSNTNDSWKEVSEEGRLAFRALFSREVLPQSFSLQNDLKNKECPNNTEKYKQNANEKDNDAAKLDINNKTLWGGSCSSHQGVERTPVLRDKDDRGMGILTMGGLGHGKLKACRTGFKPYKRCSVEAKEISVASTSSQNEEKCAKRIRLEGKAST